MSKLRKIGLAGTASALTMATISPAAAGWNIGASQSWGGGFGGSSIGMGVGFGGGGWGGGRRHHGGGDDDTAEVLGGFLLGAIVVGAIASASKKAKQARTEPQDGRYPDSDNRTQSSSTSRGDIASEDQAVDACANAAEGKGGRTSSVRGIDRVDRSSDGWDVEGVIEKREGWRDSKAEKHRFTCSVRYGAIDSVYIESGRVALAD
jgi:hypothetical protein